MSLRNSLTIFRNEWRILRNDPMFILVFFLMPILLMAFLKDAFRAALVASGYHDVNGSEQAVPGQTVLFSFFLVPQVAWAVFREHGWGTWDRLRASPVSSADIILGKAIVPLLTVSIQLSLLFAVGTTAFGLHVRGSVAGIVLVASALTVCLVSFGFFLLSLFRTWNQLTAASNLGTVVLAGFGGAMVPISLMPGWARAVAPATPSYWAMRGFRSEILLGEGIGATLLPFGVLLMFSVGFLAVAFGRFRVAQPRIGLS